jgi:hypothetical protein
VFEDEDSAILETQSSTCQSVVLVERAEKWLLGRGIGDFNFSRERSFPWAKRHQAVG